MRSESELANVEVEKAVLGVVLDGRRPGAMAQARTVLPHPLYFTDRNHKLVWLACLWLDDNATPVDSTAVSDALMRWRFDAAIDALRRAHEQSGAVDSRDRARLRMLYRVDCAPLGEDSYADSALAAIGGFNGVTDLALSYAPSDGFPRNVALVAEYYARRQLVAELDRTRDEAFGRTSPAELASTLGQRLMRLDVGTDADLRSVTSAADAVAARLTVPRAAAIKTGMAKLDEVLTLRPGGVFVLAALTGAGKTTLALNIAAHVAETQPVIYFSLEVDAEDLTSKLAAARSGVPFADIDAGRLGFDAAGLVETELARIKDLRLTFNDGSHTGITQVVNATRRECMKPERPGLVVVDHCQLLGGTDPKHSEYERISEITRTLKATARSLNIPVLLLSQMSRDSQKGQGDTRKPRLSDLRGSGTLEQDADAVLFLHKNGTTRSGQTEVREVSLIVAKNRFGPADLEIPFHFEPATMRMTPATKPVKADARDMNEARRQLSRTVKLNTKPDDSEDLFRQW